MVEPFEGWGAPLQLAFVDESGDAHLDTAKSGTSTFFVVAAVLLPAEAETQVRAACEAVRSSAFGLGEIKSSGVGNNHGRRLRILQALHEVSFRTIALAVDKREIWKTGGLIYKQPFMKFLNGQLYRRLYRAFPSLDVVADQHGSTKFMEGFEKYMKANHVPSLFDRAEFEFRDSSSDVLVQLADFVAGTVHKIVDPTTPSDKATEFMSALRPKLIHIEEWPPTLARYLEPESDRSVPEDDRLVARQAMLGVIEFLDSDESDEEERKARQRATLNYLLFTYRYVDSNAYVSTGELRRQLADTFGEEISEHSFRSSVIAPLRDRGLLIASSSKGYKIPSSVEDLAGFVQQYHGIMQPMIRRVKSARDSIKLASEGRVDVLAGSQYEYLRRIVDFKRPESE